MPVILEKGKKEGFLQCERCKKRSAVYKATSPAAPSLSICELAGKEEGWVYDLGFFPMLRGHQTVCKNCANASSL